MNRFSLDGRRLQVVEHAANSSLTPETELILEQSGNVLSGRYRGGSIIDGYLIGRLSFDEQCSVHFRYVQADIAGRLDSGVSNGVVSVLRDGRVRLTEEFEWLTAEGAGVNVFEEQ